MSEGRIHVLTDINDAIEEGRMLLVALAQLSTKEGYKKMIPSKIIRELNSIVDYVYHKSIEEEGR